MIDAQTGCVALFGDPVAHSLSPQMHNAAFLHLGLNLVYLAFRVEKAAQAVAAMRALGLKGASVTVPHKETVAIHLDQVDKVAAAIGAVNTLAWRGNRLTGYNTDWLGVVKALEQVTPVVGKRCLILGAGGAARAAVYGLMRERAQVFVSNRSRHRGLQLAAEMGCTFIDWQLWEQQEVELLINATTVGMSPRQEQSLVPSHWLNSQLVILDMVYRPLKTRLLQDAEVCGCRTVSGLEMLLYQGVAQFETWTGREAPAEVMRRALLAGLENEAYQNGPET